MRIDLLPAAVRWPNGQVDGTLLPRLLAALRHAHAGGGARAAQPCTRAHLRELLGLPQLHRTQLWRALRRLEATPLAGLVLTLAPSSGPYWFDEAVLARLAWHEAPDLLPTPLHAGSTTWQVLPLAYVEALAQADHCIDRGELLPARHSVAAAAAATPDGDAAALLAVHTRAARIARRLGDWAGLQQTLRTMRAVLADAPLDTATRQHHELRVAVLDAWHCHASLGHADAALRQIEALDEQALTSDPALLGDWLNLRALARRDVALARGDAMLAAAALADLARALRTAALAGQPDALQVAAANLAHTSHVLAEGGLVATSAESAREALRWLFCSEAVCTRWALARNSLLNGIFLLHITADGHLPAAEVRQMALAAGLPWPDGGLTAWAAARWAQCRPVHAQIPTEQRCAFLLLWSQHAHAAGEAGWARELLAQASHHAHKLRDGPRRARYLARIAALVSSW